MYVNFFEHVQQSPYRVTLDNWSGIIIAFYGDDVNKKRLIPQK